MKYLCSPVYTRQARRMAVEIYIRKWRRKGRSFLHGMESAAPGLVTLMAAALLASSMQRPNCFPCVSPATKYPVKVSPAAVVSTAAAFTASWRIVSVFSSFIAKATLVFLYRDQRQAIRRFTSSGWVAQEVAIRMIVFPSGVFSQKPISIFAERFANCAGSRRTNIWLVGASRAS